MEERNRTETALQESEARWRALVETAPDAIVVIDDSGIMTACNEALVRMFGYAREEMLGRNVRMLMPSPHREAHDRYLSAYRSTGVRKVIGFWRELSGRRKDGTEFPLEVSVSETHVGGQHSFTGILRDLSERKRVEEQVKEQARLDSFSARIGKHLIESRGLTDMLRRCTQTMVDDLGAAFARIWILNEEDNVLELRASSGLYTNLDGRHGRVPVGSLKIGLIAAERKPNLTNQVVGDPRVPEQDWAQREGMVAFAGYPLIIEDQVIGVMAMFSRSVLSESTLKAMAVVADQIALGIQRKRVEQALLASEERLEGAVAFQQAVMANIKEGLYTLNAQGLISYINPAAEELFGWKSEELLGRKMHDITHYKRPDGTPFPAEECAGLQVLREGKTLLEYEDVFIRKDGTFFDVMYSSAPLWRDGTIDGLVVVFHDVTQRKRAQAALLESEEGLRSLSGYLEELVQKRTEELTQSQDRLRLLAKELNLAEQRERKRLAIELHDHLQQFLVLAKLQVGQGKRFALGVPGCENVMTNVDDLLSHALTYTRTLVAELSPSVLRDHGLAAGLQWLGEYMNKHNLSVTVTVSNEEELKLPEDQVVLIFQSVRELLMNSWKHAGTGRASVAMERRDGRLQIEVRDEGKGFDLATAAGCEAIDGSSSKFGLFSIRERMRALGGRLDIQSALGKGTSATLILPIGKVQGVSQTTDAEGVRAFRAIQTEQDTGRKDRSVRILLVDDHAMMRQGLKSILAGYSDLEVVAEAANGVEALYAVEEHRPAIIIMDINMPQMNGIEATARIKARYPDIHVVGLSVNAAKENQDAMQKAGASLLLTKEAAVDELYGTIQKLTREPFVRLD